MMIGWQPNSSAAPRRSGRAKEGRWHSGAALIFASVLVSGGCARRQGTLNGDVFIVTQGGENLKLGLVEVRALPYEESKRAIAQATVLAQHEIAELQPALDAARKAIAIAESRYQERAACRRLREGERQCRRQAARVGGRVFRVPPTGIIERFAGIDAFNTGYSGDGGPATQAELSYPDALAAVSDGSLYISDSNTFTIRRVLPNGIITTVAGNPAFNDYSADGTPASASHVDFPKRMAVGVDGAVYVSDDFLMTVRKIAPPDASQSDGRLIVPSSDGRIVSVFGSNGRHQKTVDAVTNATLYLFQYDTAGRLTSIVDRYGNATTVERDGSGNATAITSPFGIRVPVHRWSLVAYSLDDLMDRGRLPVLVLWSGMVDLSSSTHLAVVLVWQILLIVRRLPLD